MVLTIIKIIDNKIIIFLKIFLINNGFIIVQWYEIAICSCGKGEVETSSQYLLGCSNNSVERLALLYTIKNIDMSISHQVAQNLLAFHFLATLFLAITKILLSLRPLLIILFQPEDFMNLYSAVVD